MFSSGFEFSLKKSLQNRLYRVFFLLRKHIISVMNAFFNGNIIKQHSQQITKTPHIYTTNIQAVHNHTHNTSSPSLVASPS